MAASLVEQLAVSSLISAPGLAFPAAPGDRTGCLDQQNPISVLCILSETCFLTHENSDTIYWPAGFEACLKLNY